MLSSHAIRRVIPLHVLAVVALVVGASHPEYFYWTAAGWLLWGPIGVGIGFHRLLSHRSFSCSAPTRAVLTAMGMLSGQSSPLAWAALHRHHHTFADTPLDLHSPKHGFWHAFMGWQVLAGAPATKMAIPKDLARDPYLRFLHRHYDSLFWGAMIVLALIDWHLPLFLIALPSVIYTHLVNLVDTVCHNPRMGYRNFETPDGSVNNLILGYLTLGVGFHNNHHAQPSSWFFQRRWFEFDLGGYLIVLLRRI